MEKNVYQILQDWYELLKNGAITEAEFAEKKKELLGTGQKKEKATQTEEPIRVLTPEEQTQSDAEYEMLFNNKSWFKKNKILLLIAFIITIVSGFAFFKLKTDKKEDVEIELKTNVSVNAAKEITLILENNKKIKLNKFPESDDIIGDLDNDIRDSAIRCFIDIDDDNHPELITQYFTGGAHCCYVTDIFTKISNNTFKRIFSYPGEISVKKNGVSLYYYEDIGYFNTCYACGADVKLPSDISPEINLKFQNNSFEFSERNEKLNEEIEENLKTLKARGIPNMSNDDFSQDDGTRKEYAINIVVYFFNNERDLIKTKELFFNYYSHEDKNKIWNELEEYLNGKNSSLKKGINFKTD